jgi:hypothetical protein
VERRAVTGMAVFLTRSSLIGYLASYGEFSWFSHVDLEARVAGIPAPFHASYRNTVFVAHKCL